MKNQGFTIIELITVVAITAVVAAITVPVVANAKKSARQTTCLSNLRQCGSALLIYEADHQALPVGDAARFALAKAPTCDPQDSWRKSCEEPSAAPRIGSYGYVRLCPEFADDQSWAEEVNSARPPSLLISIDYGSRRVKPFSGMAPNYPRCLHGFECVMPDRIPSFEFDGSAKRRKVGSPTIVAGVPFQVFTWPSAFDRN